VLLLELDDPRWAAFVSEHPEALPFHHPAWTRALAGCYGYRPLVIAWADGRRLAGGLPVIEVRPPLGGRRWVALPFTDYCPPLVQGLTPERVAEDLVEEARSRNVRLEVRAGLPRRAGLHSHVAAVRHTSALPSDPSPARGGLSKMHQRNLRRAEQAGVQVGWGSSAADVDTFYGLHVLTRRRQGVPVQPRRFFHSLAEQLVAPGLARVLTARAEGVPVAAALFLAWKGVLVYKYGASDSRFWNVRPNNLLFWTAMRWGSENGYRTLDWGRTDLADEGLRTFKRGWGASETPLAYSATGDRPAVATTARLRAAIALMIRNSSPLVCRAMGELLYRYAA
jgi:CelD/BcsL family acetyltransferase involved in cellulose biosynthesis